MRDLWKPEERVSLALRELYSRFGYARFKMSKFEAYDLYMQNKEFLVSDGILTFTDTDGTLMALKPDVTLSIVKHFRRDENPLQKVCYNETVYRISPTGHGYREIMQSGLECIGDVGLYELCEVILLAAKSLQTVSPRYILELSHLDVLSCILADLALTEQEAAAVMEALAEKNEGALQTLLSPEQASVLTKLLQISGPILPALEQLESVAAKTTLQELRTVTAFLVDSGVPSDRLYLDFSIVSDRNYYNGIVFRGYVDGIPSEILSGGQYDRLMEKMGKPAQAVGFAVYLDQLELLDSRTKDYDIDTVVLYDRASSPAEIRRAAEALEAEQVLLLKDLPKRLRFRRLLHLENGTLTEVEDHG